ncbi:ferredoxin [Glutamicibacter sp. JL.03c]|uniref:ferredoxin n=1 Tax=Glutamicibacter sp. JL.03c TaxID=2984842 RepID=UPI0021F70F80|nr:ferredoxin [Glutamicibacter sp. JL.03c]UYQ77048.1 ferredoxin [Glutamicibacter sp. JL.03c]
MSAELNIDWTRCQGRGLCIELLTGVLDSDPWGYPLALDGRAAGHGRVHVVGDHLEAAREAVKMCPLSALSLQEEAGALEGRR